MESLTISPENDNVIAEELREVVPPLIDKHVAAAKDWKPYELIDYDQARSFTPNQAWSPEEYPLPKGVRSAIYVNLLTEDGLPYYTSSLLAISDTSHPLNEWTRRWTAEEGRHSDVMREWVHTSRALDPELLEAGRIAQVSGGEVPTANTLSETIAYVSFQELATNIAHRNTGKMLDKERGGKKVMARVAGDENLHHEFYRDVAKAALEIDPSTMILAIFKRLKDFAMPGTGIPNFEEHTARIVEAGIYDLQQFTHRVVKPTLEYWQIDKITGLSDEAELARCGLQKHMKVLDRAASAQQRMLQADSN